MATLTFRIYKNELDENRLDYIRKRYSMHIIETPKVLEAFFFVDFHNALFFSLLLLLALLLLQMF